ncbi:FAD dependent oxidoreductase-like protein [Apiospora kogelbergensis]|uniref:FAD dependent oxidoreductase-like protein n=1 Tax=Apiospora kogelbergensis TaxID=1337665 RepID=UPI0031322EE2
MAQVVVLGAGVIGLSSALQIQSRGYQVTIIARDFPGPFETVDPRLQIDYTSPWGGAHNRWIVPTNAAEEREHAMALRTFARMREINQNHPCAGITFLPGIEYLEAPSPVYKALDAHKANSLGMEGFRMLTAEELPDDKVKMGFEYNSWCVNPMVYCSFLLRRFGYLGGKVVKKEVRSPVEIFEMRELGKVDAVINASGIGFGDDNVFVTRGQTCLVANPCLATITRQNADGSWSFSVPRNFDGGTVIGGTKEPNNWDPHPSSEVRTSLLHNFAATYPQILGQDQKYRVIADIVGRRPTRKNGMRLEKELTQDGQCIIHAYGLGGRGYELSWGVSEAVASLLSGHLGDKSPSQKSRL